MSNSHQIIDLLDEGAFSSWQQSLLLTAHEKREAAEGDKEAKRKTEIVWQRQNELLDALHSPRSAYLFLLGQLKISEEIVDMLPDLSLYMGEKNLKQLSTHDEEAIAVELNDQGLTAAVAASPAFWGFCHTKWIDQEMFGSDLLMVFCGKSEIPRRGTLQEKRDPVTNCVRQFLRFSGGLPHVNGSVAVLRDCPISKAWWRWRLAYEISSTLDNELGLDLKYRLSPQEVHEYLQSGGFWRELVEVSVRRVTAINAPRARAALVAAAIECGGPGEMGITQENMGDAIKSVGQLSHSHSLHQISFERMIAAAVPFFRPVDQQLSSDDKDLSVTGEAS